MQSVTDLTKLRDSIISRVYYLRSIIRATNTPLSSSDRRSVAYVTIELDNLVIVGLRQYTKSSLLRSRTTSGARIISTVTPTSTEQAAAHIFQSLNPAGYANKGSPATINERDEIVFRDPKRTEKVFTDYSTSNLPNLVVALSLNAEVFSEAKICRHFFAHRSKNTFESVRVFAGNLGVHGINSTEDFVMIGRPGTGVRIVEGWLSNIEIFFDLAC